ncbi:MAG: alpha/beta fold hydrolase [Pseudomonadales bacterium]
MNMLKKLLMLLCVLAALLVSLYKIGLRDNPGRPAIGVATSVQSGSANIEYYVRGPAEGTPVVLLPGWARSISDFNELVTELNAAGYRTLAINARGVEGSTLPDSDMTLHAYAADVKSVLDTEQYSSVAIVAHAYGNRIARTFAHDYPNHSHGLVLLAAGGEEPTPKAVSQAIMKIQFSLFPYAVREQATEFAFFAEGNRAPQWWVSGWYPTAGIAQANATRAISTGRTDPAWVAGGDDPMVILEPAEDAAASGAGEVLMQRHPNRVTLRIIDKAGHALLPEQPEETARLVIEALAGFH